MAGIFSQGGSAGHRYAGWLSEVEAKNFQFGGKVFNGSPSAIFVGSKMVWANWLMPATKQAILGAFGQTDGKAVINATNAYLTDIAGQGQAGKAKAQALAALINEDPMMVCNIVDTGKEYVLVGKGAISFTFALQNDYVIEMKTTRDTSAGGSWGFVAGANIDNILFLGWRRSTGSNLWYRRMGQYGEHFSSLGNDEEFIQVNTKTYDSVRTNIGRTSTKTYTGADLDKDYIFTVGGSFQMRFKYVKTALNGVENHRVVPFLSKTYGATLIDLETGEIGIKSNTANYTTEVETATVF